MPNDKLADYLVAELEERGWSARELARRSGLSPQAVVNAMNGSIRPTAKTALAIAKALGEAPEKIFRLAGLLPNFAADETDLTFNELLAIVKELPPSVRLEILQYARFRYQQGKKRALVSSCAAQIATG